MDNAERDSILSGVEARALAALGPDERRAREELRTAESLGLRSYVRALRRIALAIDEPLLDMLGL